MCSVNTKHLVEIKLIIFTNKTLIHILTKNMHKNRLS